MLRDYQLKAIDAIPNTNGKFLLVLPAGSGKSHIIKALSNDNTTICCHRIILLDQLRNHNCKGNIVTRQKLFKTQDKNKTLIIDECHVVGDIGQYAEILKRYDKVIGLTATPYRLDHGEITNLKWEKVYELDEQTLIDKNYLSPLIYKNIPIELLTNITHSEYASESKIFNKSKIYLDTQINYIKKNINLNKLTLIFCTNIKHCELVQDKLNCGELYHSQLPKNKRKDILKNKNDIKVLISVETLNIGFDWPECEQLINLRPTKSYALYHQLTRRVSRVYPNKKHGLIYDFTYNQFEFKGVTKKDFREICIFCGKETDKRLAKCKHCKENKIKESKKIKEKKCLNGHIVNFKSNYCNQCGLSTYNSEYILSTFNEIDVIYEPYEGLITITYAPKITSKLTVENAKKILSNIKKENNTLSPYRKVKIKIKPIKILHTKNNKIINIYY